jgi:hypothetical protein
MTNDEIQAFLTRLANDQQFRAQVEVDPVGALAPYGITVDPLDAPPHVAITLPSSQSILDKLDFLSGIFEGRLLCARPLKDAFWQQGQIPPP